MELKRKILTLKNHFSSARHVRKKAEKEDAAERRQRVQQVLAMATAAYTANDEQDGTGGPSHDAIVRTPCGATAARQAKRSAFRRCGGSDTAMSGARCADPPVDAEILDAIA